MFKGHREGETQESTQRLRLRSTGCVRGEAPPCGICIVHQVGGVWGQGTPRRLSPLVELHGPQSRFPPRFIRSFQDASSPSTSWLGGDSARFKDRPFRVIHLVSSGWRQRTQVQV